MTLLREICFVFVTFMVFKSGIAMVVIPAPTASVECSENGFKPTFNQTYVNNTEVYYDVILGGGGAGCLGYSKINGSGDGEVVDVANINTNGLDEFILYKNLDQSIKCNGSLKNNTDDTKIEYKVLAQVIVTHVIRSVIKRQKRYEFLLKCHLTKNAVTLSSGGNWTISSELERTGDVDDKNDTFTLATKLEFFKSDNYSMANRQDSEFVLAAGDNLYIQVREVNENSYFKFVVNRCWSTPNPSPTYIPYDGFFNNKCPIDDTVHFNFGDHYYRLQMKAFFFSIDKALAIYLHCDLYICQTSDSSPMCTQPDTATCAAGGKRRKRRSVDNERIERVTISSEQHIMFDNSEIYAPACAEGHVYDRISKVCTKEGILEISGVYLDIDWNPLYANTSSEAFVAFAKEKSYQLYALIQSSTTEEQRVIRGIKVVKAVRGSVILDVQIKYADTSNSASAFTEFESSLRTTRVTASRVLNILNIKQRPLKTIEYVPIITNTKSKMENLTLIVVVVVLLLVVFVSGITFFKVKQLRRRSPTSTKDINGFDNTGMDNMS